MMSYESEPCRRRGWRTFGPAFFLALLMDEFKGSERSVAVTLIGVMLSLALPRLCPWRAGGRRLRGGAVELANAAIKATAPILFGGRERLDPKRLPFL
jgi:hypothetical protein